jgi:CheY-like chemotaxis protein
MRTLLDHALAGDVVVDTDLPADLWPIEVDPTELELVILNLCVNARDAMPGGGRIRIHAANISNGCKDQGDCVRLVIADTGVGMSPDLASRVFEPFFTTKDIGKGSGLGLAQVYGFAQQSGGSVEIDSEVGIGTSIILCLPRAATAPVRLAEKASGPTPPIGDGQCILVVEDDDEVAALVTEMLGQMGFDCTRVASAEAALGALADGRRVDAVFSDVMMPGGFDGVELARELRDRRPDLPIVLTSGYADAFSPQAEAQGLSLLPKPYSSADLATVLNRALDEVGSPETQIEHDARKRHV